jgi:hypothetical protein
MARLAYPSEHDWNEAEGLPEPDDTDVDLHLADADPQDGVPDWNGDRIGHRSSEIAR